MRLPSGLEELVRRLLLERMATHAASSWSWLLLELAAPLLGLLIFMVLWSRCRAHARSLLDALAFYLLPYPPRRMAIVSAPSLGWDRVYYNDEFVVNEGRGSTTIVARDGLVVNIPLPARKLRRLQTLASLYAPGASPFGLLVRWVISAAVGVGVAAVAWSYTLPIWLGLDAAARSLGIALPPPLPDLLATSILVVQVGWFLLTLATSLRREAEVYAVRVEGVRRGGYLGIPELPADSRLSTTSLWEIIEAVKGEAIEVSEEARSLAEKLGARPEAVAVALESHRYWRSLAAKALRDAYELALGARLVSRPWRPPRALLTILLAAALVAAVIMLLQPSIAPAPPTHHPAAPTATGYTPAPPPQPPSTTPNATATPAPPPPPPGVGG